MTTGEPSLNTVSQFAHFGAGATIALSFGLFGHWMLGSLLVLVWAGPKEFIFDILVEKDSWTDSVEDFSFYLIGVIYALGLNWIR